MTTNLNDKYGLNPAHSEVVEACTVIAPCNALDMGCSNGRNALYLGQHGFNVTAVDTNINAVNALQHIITQEGISNIKPQVYDINNADLGAEYGFITCTVTLMFIRSENIDSVIANMQNCTVAGGYNLIVCAMDTEEYPCPMNFPFTFKAGQLKSMYQGWEFIKYNENLGTMHHGARLQFATMLARKA